MKRILIITAIMGISITSMAQLFGTRDTLSLKSSSDSHITWADIDNDSEFDIVMASKDSVGRVTLMKLSANLVIEDTLLLDSLSDTRFKVADLNNDNRLDVIGLSQINGVNWLSIYYQDETQSFGDAILLDSAQLRHLTIIDLDNNGFKDMVYMSGGLVIQWQSITGWNKEKIDIAKLSNGELQVYDAMADGWADIWLTGLDDMNDYHSIFISNHDSLAQPIDSSFFNFEVLVAENADLDADGQPDWVASGLTSGNNVKTEILYATGERKSLDSLIAGDVEAIFIGDINSDGWSDLNVTLVNGECIVLLNQANEFSIEPLSNATATSQWFADMDFDGDLDRLIVKEDSAKLIIQENITEVQNEGPSIPARHVAFSVGNEVKIFWQPSEDDFTDPRSITYDVFVGTEVNNSDFMASNFNLSDVKRMLVVHGNAGYRTEKVIEGLPAGEYSYGIQSIDNAYHHFFGGEGTACGRPIACGKFVVCDDNVVFENIAICKQNDSLTLIAEEVSGWYSSNQGFLGFSKNMQYTPSGAIDTVYANLPDNVDCSKNKVYVIEQHEAVNYNLEDQVICKGETVDIQLPILQDSIIWTNAADSVLSETERLVYTPLQTDTIYVEGFLGSCRYTDMLLITVLDPQLSIANSQLQIVKGNTVQLNVTGAESYQWTPPESLNNNTIPNPIASPVQTTRYTVTGTDSLGCSGTLEILIVVEENGFVPELFTPNNDGVNDRLLLYGLSNAQDFEFSIYNRSGVRVYQTSNITEATQQGWDGLLNGSPQANGVYYWKITGQFTDGSKVQLNGNESGVTYLMR